MIKKCAYLLSIIAIIVFLSACEIIIPKQFGAKEEVVLEKYKNVPLKDVMRNVQQKFDKAKSEEMYFYSPNNYRTARTGVQGARAYFRDPEKKTYVLSSLYRAEQALDDGFEVKVIVEREMKDLIRLRDTLDVLEAKKSHTREYRSLMTSLVAIVETIESKKEALFQDPSSKADFEERKKEMMADLENFRLRVVKFKYLNHGELLVSEADAYDAKNIAPVTYGEVIKARNEALDYIKNNIENLEGIYQIAKVFETAAQRLMHITREVHNVINLEPKTHEQYVLRQEERLVNLANALKLGDLRNQTFSAQTTQLVSAVKRVNKEKEQNALKIAELSSGTGSAVSGAQSPVASEEQSAESSGKANVADQDAENKPKGLAIVPISDDSGGDLEQLKKSVRILTDQVYQLTIEKTNWEAQRAQLNSKIKQLQSKLQEKQKAAKPKPAAQNKKKQEDAASTGQSTDTVVKQQSSQPAQGDATVPAENKQ